MRVNWGIALLCVPAAVREIVRQFSMSSCSSIPEGPKLRM